MVVIKYLVVSYKMAQYVWKSSCQFILYICIKVHMICIYLSNASFKLYIEESRSL